MQNLKYFLIVTIAIFLSSCNNNFDKEELQNIKIGTTKTELYTKVGEPLNHSNVERLFFSNNTILILNNKVSNYFISPVLNDTVANFNKIRIGMSADEVDNLLHTPDKIENIEIIHYKDHQEIYLSDNKVESIDLHAFQDMRILDKIRINFNGGGMLVLNIALSIIMFGIALGIKIDDFKLVLKKPKSLYVGIFSQFLILPFLTYILIIIVEPTTSVALGMILVAASPGGNISNFMTSLSKGNSALSISLTAFATLSSIFMTPINFSIWGNLYSSTSDLIVPIEIDSFQMLKTVLLLLGGPVILGLFFRHKFEKTAIKLVKPLKIFSIIFFLALIVGAMSANFSILIDYIYLIVLLVLVHNLIALVSGYLLAKSFKLPKIDRRTISIETGIQNSGLALVLILNPKLFDGLGGMAIIAAWWGIWHIVSGFVIATIWSKRPV